MRNIVTNEPYNPTELIILAGKLHPVGGIETHLLHFGRLVVRHFSKVTMVITSHDYSSKSKHVLAQAGVRLAEFDCASGPRGIFERLRCLKFLRANSSRNSIFYSNGTTGFAAAVRPLMRSRCWVHHHHSDVTPEMIHGFSNSYQRVLQNADWLLACTSNQGQLLGTHYARAKRTLFLPCCKAEPEAVSPMEKNRPRRKPPVIAFFGRLRESKGVKVLLALADWFKAQGLECRLHGDDCEGILRAGVPEGIVWKGAYEPDRDLDQLLATVDLVVLPTSFPEGLPLVIAEAISRGVPVVAFGGGGVRDLIDFHPGLLVVPATIPALQAGILEMLARLDDSTLPASLAQEYRLRLSNQVCLDWWTKLGADAKN